MLKKLFLISTISLLCSFIIGCTLNQPRIKDDTNCARLKSQALYNATNPNYEASWLTNTQQGNLKQQMVKNNCN